MYDVTIDRNKYIGGSDIPCIMDISPFKTRYQLLLEKAELVERDFTGNIYTKYGQVFEPKIREYINTLYYTDFKPNRVIKDNVRCHTDGFNGKCVLEIKTTSKVYDNVNDYKQYLVQLIKYMEVNEVDKGILAVYHRPNDFSEVFDPERLQIYEIALSDYQNLLIEINFEIDRFLSDLERLSENPLLSEQDFQPNEVVKIAKEIQVLEKQMAQYKVLEKQYKDMKQALYEEMVKYNVKSWEMPNGTKITRVDGTEPSVKEVEEFNLDLFKIEQAELHKNYTRVIEKKTAGRSGYVKITIKQEKE